MMANPYEVSNRLKKAHELARILFRFDFTVQQAKLMTQADWARAAQSAGVKIPSLATQQLSIEMLEKLYRPLYSEVA